MGIFSKKPTPQAQQTAPVNNILVNESVRGKLIPVALGTVRMPMWLIWNDDFRAINHTTTQHVGGGLFGSGGGDTTQTTTTYQTAFQAGLCYGKVNHIANVWNGSGKVQAIEFTETHTVPIGGGIIRPTPPGGVGVIGNRGVGFVQNFSATVTDFGAPASTTLSGTFIMPMLQGSTPSTGVYTVDPSTGDYTFSAGDGGKSVQINYTANFTVITSQEQDVIPSGGTIQVPNSTLFAADGGVNLIDASTFAQTPMVKVSASPAAGQYTVNSTGLYSFNAADHGKFVLITWQQTDPTATGAAATLNFSLIEGVEGQAPWSYLSGAHPDAAIGYSGIATLQSQALQLGSGAEMPQLSFEVIGSYLAGGTNLVAGGNIDCNPSDVLYAYLTDHLFGIDFPTANIEWGLTSANLQTGGTYLIVPFVNAPGMNAAAFWAANNYFISPLIENQTTVSQEFANILEAGQCAVIWSEGILKLRPYGDTSAAGNGFIYTPLTQPVFDLGIDDFIAGSGEDAIKVSRSAWNGIYNIVQIQYSDRLNGYENEVIQEEDLASIQAYGEQREDPQDYSGFIRASWVAQWVANMRVKRLSNIRNTYEFTIPAVYDILEPMDLVTLTHPGYGFNKKPVRITKIEDDPEKGLTITAEDFPYGIAKATLYPKQTNLADNKSPALEEPGNAEPLILELPDQFTQFQGYTMRIYAVPDTPENWGGAEVWLSGDNVEFDPQGSITTPALSGTLSGSMAAGTGDPDTGTTITVVVDNGLQILPASSFDFSNHSESCLLCIIDAAGTFEIVAYQNAVLTGVNTYQISTFHRGLFGTTRASHAAGSKVLKMDQGHLELTYPPSQVGTTNYVKLTSFNTVGARTQDVNIVASSSFLLTGAFPGFFDKTTGKLFSMSQVTGAGALATKNNVDLATTDVINKTATNIAYTGGATVDSLKPAEVGAEKTTGKSLDILADGTSFRRVAAGHFTSGTNLIESLAVPDTRATNQLPSWYRTNYPKKTVTEFKQASTIGLTGTGTFVTLHTKVPWSDTSGGVVVQEVNGSNGVWTRKGSADDTAWGSWFLSYDNQNKPGLDNDVLDGTSFVRTTPNEKTGAARGFNAIDGSNIVVAGSIDFSRAYTNKNQDNIADGTTFKRLANVASDNKIHVSTSLNPQGSVLPNQGVLINFKALPNLIVGSWVSQSLLRSDSSSLTVNSSAGANLVINGDGESGTVGAAAPNWGNTSGFAVTTVNDAVVSGSKALEINNTSGTNSLGGQTVNVTGGQTYAVEGWIKTDALPAISGHGAFIIVTVSTGVTSLSVITTLGAAGTNNSTQLQMGFAADGATHGYTFFQGYFVPNATGQVLVFLQNISNGGRVWFDNVALYPFSGAIYSGLSASTTYHLYPYCQVSTGSLLFANGAPPPTSVSDTFAQQSVLDGRVGFQPCSITTPASGTSTPSTGTGGGSGTCPECNEPVYIERYSEDGVLVFSGEVKAGDVRIGYESDDGTVKRGDFLKGHSFKKNADVYRAVQKVTHVHCNGWVIVDGHRVTACEQVYYGQWMAAWKVPGSTHDRLSSWKVLIQVEADWDDEHNFYVGDLLIHNSIILPC